MSTGFLSPDPRLRELSDLGLVQAGALLHTYVAGTTSTPLAAYTDAALTIPHANPIVASAGGLFPAIYLTPGVAYKYVLTDALGNPLWQQDPVLVSGVDFAALANHGVVLGTGALSLGATAAGAAGTVLTGNGASADPTFQVPAGTYSVCQGRLTLTAGLPVTTGDVLAATTLRFTPYAGNLIGLYSGSAWAVFSFAELSIAVPATTSQMYDVFVFNNSGTPALELLAWTNDTTRATALVLQDGILVKTGALTRRYVGSFRTTGVSGQTEDSKAKRYVWNYYNRVPRVLRVADATATWPYSTATPRQANGAVANQVEVVIGVAEVRLALAGLVSASSNNNVPALWSIGIGEDSTTTYSSNQVGGRSYFPGTAGAGAEMVVQLAIYPAVGRHFYAWLENNDSGNATTTWNGTTGNTASGLVGSIEG